LRGLTTLLSHSRPKDREGNSCLCRRAVDVLSVCYDSNGRLPSRSWSGSGIGLHSGCMWKECIRAVSLPPCACAGGVAHHGWPARCNDNGRTCANTARRACTVGPSRRGSPGHGEARAATVVAWPTAVGATGTVRRRWRREPPRPSPRHRRARGVPSPQALCPAGTAAPPPSPRQGVVQQRLRRMGSPRSRRLRGRSHPRRRDEPVGRCCRT
jgi:hypothetical protein